MPICVHFYPQNGSRIPVGPYYLLVQTMPIFDDNFAIWQCSKKLPAFCLECGYTFAGLVKKETDSIDCPNCEF